MESTAVSDFAVEESSLGRIVVAPSLPRGKALFYTTSDFPGRLDEEIARLICGVIAERFEVGATLTTCTQVHGATVRGVTSRTPAAPAEAGDMVRGWSECDSCDALWASENHVALGIKVADCLPVTLIDDEHDVIANIHSGWRGAVQKITSATLDAIEHETTFDPASAFAWLGPSIRACCFEVGEEVVDQFSASYENAASYVDRSRAKAHIDVPALTIDLLRARGFRPGRIFDSAFCTRCGFGAAKALFHSFRRDRGGGGRNLAIVAQ